MLTVTKEMRYGVKAEVYPNPNNGSFDIRTFGFAKNATIQLTTITGQLLKIYQSHHKDGIIHVKYNMFNS